MLNVCHGIILASQLLLVELGVISSRATVVTRVSSHQSIVALVKLEPRLIVADMITVTSEFCVKL